MKNNSLDCKIEIGSNEMLSEYESKSQAMLSLVTVQKVPRHFET